jgi:hypothetical protein
VVVVTMRAAPLLALVLVVAPLALAGCIGSSAPPSTETTQADPPNRPAPRVDLPEEEPAAVMVVYPFAGKITASAGASQVGYVSPTGSVDEHVFLFPVQVGTTAIVAELSWPTPVHDLDLELGTPDCDSTMGTGTCVFSEGGMPGAGDSPVKIVFDDPQILANAGDWKLLVWAKDAVNTEFTAAVTVFYAGAPAADYTAIES